VSEDLNVVKNPDFLAGKTKPRGWTWGASSESASWRREEREGSGAPVMIVEADGPAAAGWSQVVTVKPGEHYRIEATLAGALHPGSPELTSGEDPGAVDPVADEGDAFDPDEEIGSFGLAVTPMVDGKPADEACFTPVVRQATEPFALRTIYQVPEGVRRLKLEVGIQSGAGWLHIYQVRVIEVLEPDETSHPLAIPTPVWRETLPVASPNGLLVCSETAAERRLTQLLRQAWGEDNVSTCLPGQLKPTQLEDQAVLLTDAVAPSAVRSLKALYRLAADRIVIMSLPAFAKLAGAPVKLRRIEQADDPICAKVMYGCPETQGLAMVDVFAYAWPGREVGSFAHHQFRKTPAFGQFCKREGFDVLLTSMCDQDSTSDQPICLRRLTAGGGGALYVLDVEPVEVQPSSFLEPTLAMHLLLSVLGRHQAVAGQYTSPAPRSGIFREQIREMAVRFPGVVVHDADVPSDQVEEQMVQIGGEDHTFGLPVRRRPVILIRSGLTAGDAASVYGSWLWFKQLVRMSPHECPYAPELLSQFRLLWLPCVAPWEARMGWQASGRSAAAETALDVDDGELAALIDVVSTPGAQPRLLLPQEDGAYARYGQWLPALHDAFGGSPYFGLGWPARADFTNRDELAWHEAAFAPEVAVDPQLAIAASGRSVKPASSDDEDAGEVADAGVAVDAVVQEAAQAGAEIVRLELPGGDAEFVAHSIARTHVAMTLLEHVVGLQYGLLAVNRSRHAATLDGFAAVGPGEGLAVPMAELRKRTARAG
jgi:hypothetical protein